MQLLRCYHPRGWPAAIHLEGRTAIDAALCQGNGAILWVTQSAFSDLVTKRALHEAGYAVSHLSRNTHGPRSSAATSPSAWSWAPTTRSIFGLDLSDHRTIAAEAVTAST